MKGRKRRWWVGFIVPVLLIAAGIGILGKPLVSTVSGNARLGAEAGGYSVRAADRPPGEAAAELDAARAYNEGLGSMPVHDPWSEGEPTQDPQYAAYLSQLSGLGAMARLVVPAGGIDLPVFHGTDIKTLSRGAGHMFGTALPGAGEGRSVIAGHTGMSSATMFDNLVNVGVGDAFYLDVAGERMKYEVREVSVVLPDDMGSVEAVPGRELVTLLTCTPYGSNSHRLLVTGERVPVDPAVPAERAELDRVLGADSVAAGGYADVRWQPWMKGAAGLIGSSVAVLALSMAVAFVKVRRRS